MTASMAMPRARVVARTVISTPGTVDSAMKANKRIRAAEVTSRPVFAMPSTTARSVADPAPRRSSAPGWGEPVVLLTHAGEQQDLVVHGEAEQECERGDRHPQGDGPGQGRAARTSALAQSTRSGRRP